MIMKNLKSKKNIKKNKGRFSNIRKKVILKPFKRRKQVEDRLSEAFANVPRITNETVADHREAVLSSARKYIYPLSHSKHRVVRVSIILFVTVIIAFFAYCGLALYKFQSTSAFIYDVTEVIPFPIAKAGPSWVSYDSYLFQLRRNMHYYETQQFMNFGTANGKAVLQRLKQQALSTVILDAYVKQLATANHVSVSNQTINNTMALLQKENRLGSSPRVFNDVLEKYWGWNIADFKRELKQQLLQQAVVAKLDTGAYNRANSALAQLQKGANFGTVALQMSNDASTKANGGQYPAPITLTNQSLPPQIVSELFTLKPGQISPIINTGYSLEILKVISSNGQSVQAAHIQFRFKSINYYVTPLMHKKPVYYYVNV